MSKWVCKRDCPRRSPTCHASCPEYLEYAAENERIRQKRAAEQRLSDAFHDISQLPRPRRKKGG